MKNIRAIIKIILILLTIIMLIISIQMIRTTYAVFQSELSGVASKKIGKWEIIVNDTAISSGIEESFLVDEFEIEESNYVEENKIAPGLECSFEIKIDPSDTDVSIKYAISLDTSIIENYAINILDVTEVETNNELIQIEPNTYVGVIPLQKIKNGEDNTIKITFEWENNEDYNEVDTAIGTKKNSKLQIPITVIVTQYLGEEII